MIRAALKKQFAAGPESGSFSLNVEFDSSSGVTVLFGPSGSGKTLTLDCIAGFVRPDTGRIEIAGTVLFDSQARVNLPPQRRRCGYVFQNYALFPHMTMRQNLDFAAASHPKAIRERKVTEMLERFRLSEIAGRRPYQVSGGQQQRGSIARALINEPSLLLLDEPARGLDAPLRAELYQVLRQVRVEFGTPILLVTHDLDECFELGDEVLIMDAGSVVQRGTPREVMEHPASVDVARLLGRFNLLEVLVVDPATGRLRLGDAEFIGPTCPDQRAGGKVQVYCRPERVRALAEDGTTAENRISADLLRVSESPAAVRLEFSGGITVEMPYAEFERNRDNESWVIEFPKGCVGIF